MSPNRQTNLNVVPELLVIEIDVAVVLMEIFAPVFALLSFCTSVFEPDAVTDHSPHRPSAEPVAAMSALSLPVKAIETLTLPAASYTLMSLNDKPLGSVPVAIATPPIKLRQSRPSRCFQ